MIDEASSLNSFVTDAYQTTATFVAVAAAGTAELFVDCVELVVPFEAAVACFHLILTAELSSDYQGC